MEFIAILLVTLTMLGIGMAANDAGGLHGRSEGTAPQFDVD